MKNSLIGKEIKLIRMEDPYTSLKSGDVGTISSVDSTGTIFVNWQNGSKLGVIPGIDEYQILENKRFIKLFKDYKN